MVNLHRTIVHYTYIEMIASTIYTTAQTPQHILINLIKLTYVNRRHKELTDRRLSYR